MQYPDLFEDSKTARGGGRLKTEVLFIEVPTF
jgi:hypothetical protein